MMDDSGFEWEIVCEKKYSRPSQVSTRPFDISMKGSTGPKPFDGILNYVRAGGGS